MLVRGCYGFCGIDWKFDAIDYDRSYKVPFLGIGLVMQLAIVEYVRNVAGLKEAHSAEVNQETPDPVIDLTPEQKKVADLGGTLRLCSYSLHVIEETKAR